MSYEYHDADARPPELRERALRRLKQRRDFRGHVLIYLLVNAFLTVIWWMTSSEGFFWPMFVMVGWGIAVVMNAYDVYVGGEITEDEIEREMDHLTGR